MPWIADYFNGRTPFIETDAIDPETGKIWNDTLGVKQAAVFGSVFKGREAPYDSSELPQGLRLAKPRKAFPDLWIANGGLLIISEALREIIEAHDPGVHKIWPVAMMTKRGERYPGPFFGLVPMVHAAAISEEHGDVMISEEKLIRAKPIFSEYVRPRSTRLGCRGSGHVCPGKLPTAHVWWDHGLTDNYLLISDALQNAIEGAKLRTLHFEKLSLVPEADNA